MLREGIISSLEKFATILEFKKESPFKIRAYLNAVERIRGISEEEFERLIVEKKLESIEGIGKALAAKITEYYETGKIEALIRVLGEVPPGLFELLKIRGLGSAQIRELHEKLGISDVSELEYACRENRLVRIRGFGEKKQANILSGIEFLKGAREFQLFIDAETIFHSLAEKLKTIPGVGMVVEGGALARKCEVVNCVDVSVLTEDVESLMAGIKDGMKGIEISSAGGILALRHPDFPRINIMTVGRDDFALKSLLFTCTESLGMALLRTVGAESLPRHNRRKDSPPARKSGIPSATESPPREIISREALEEAHKEIFRSAGLQYIPVELREDTLILETAAKFEIPDLVDSRDIRGALHVHTTYSDGANGIEEIARACMERGLEYVGISDHSKSASYAGGLKEEDILRQHDEIDKLNRSFSGFRILKGIECDILPDGSLDYSEDILKRFDFIIASVHSRFRMSDEEMTARIVNAVETGYVNILGHLTGRLLLGREGYKLDVRRVIKACAANKTAIELNSDPMRLDLDWRNHAIAREHGVKIAICPDAHNIECLEFIRYGINIARKGMLTAGDIINTRNYKDIMEFFSKRGHIGDSYLWR